MKRRRGVGGVNVNLGGKVNLGEVQARCVGDLAEPADVEPAERGAAAADGLEPGLRHLLVSE